MKTFSALLALYAGNSPVPVNSPHKGQWRGALMFSLIYAWINDWVNNREAGDLRRQRGHYDVIVMINLITYPNAIVWYDHVGKFPNKSIEIRVGSCPWEMEVLSTWMLLSPEYNNMSDFVPLIHWGGMTHICVTTLTIIGSDNGLSSGWRQAIIWNNTGI